MASTADIFQIVIIVVVMLVSCIFYFIKYKSLDRSFLSFIAYSVLAGSSLYAGIIWVLKPFNLISDPATYDSLIYNILVGLVLIVLSILIIKEELNKKDESRPTLRN